MPNQLGPIEICCDAPSYPVVHACETLGFQTPLDVGWVRVSPLPLSGEPTEDAGRSPWKWLFGNRQQQDNCCHCGERLPTLERYTFQFLAGNSAHYLLGQCRRCGTIFWKQD